MEFIYRFFRALCCFIWDGFSDCGALQDEHRLDHKYKP